MGHAGQGNLITYRMGDPSDARNTFYHYRCRSHLPLLTNNVANCSKSLHTSADGSESSSRAQTPQCVSETGGRLSGYTVGPEKGTGGSTGVGSGSGKIDSSGNAFFDCLVCSRPVSPNSNRASIHNSC